MGDQIDGTGDTAVKSPGDEANAGERSQPTADRDGIQPGALEIVASFAHRELSTAILTPMYAILTFFLTVILFGVVLLGSGTQTGYVAAIIDLLVPLQFLVPVLAVMFGYNAIFSDKQRGELDVLQTYPVTPWQFVLGVYIGKAIGLVGAIALPLLFLIILIAGTPAPQLPGYAAHTGSDSLGLYMRMVVLTVLFALVVLAVVIAVSALVETARNAVVGAGVTLVILVVALDLAIVSGFSLGYLGDSTLVTSLAFSPLSAYRGLVLETSVVVTTGTGPQTAAPIPSLIGLLVWGIGSLAVTKVAVARS